MGWIRGRALQVLRSNDIESGWYGRLLGFVVLVFPAVTVDDGRKGGPAGKHMLREGMSALGHHGPEARA